MKYVRQGRRQNEKQGEMDQSRMVGTESLP